MLRAEDQLTRTAFRTTHYLWRTCTAEELGEPMRGRNVLEQPNHIGARLVTPDATPFGRRRETCKAANRGCGWLQRLVRPTT